MTGQLVDRETGEVLELTPGALCRHCARVQYTCCQTEYGVSLSLHDARRLQLATGLEPEQFLQISRLKRKVAAGLRVDPLFRRLFIGRRRLLQIRQRELDCHFLGPEGCTVSPHRPRLCRLFPFWVKREEGEEPEVVYDAVRTPEAAAASPCILVQALWPERDLGLGAIGEDRRSLLREGAAAEEEFRWHQERIRALLRDRKPRELRIEHLVPVLEEAG